MRSRRCSRALACNGVGARAALEAAGRTPPSCFCPLGSVPCGAGNAPHKVVPETGEVASSSPPPMRELRQGAGGGGGRISKCDDV